MAVKEFLDQSQHFVEEIDYKEIVKLEVVGKGSFGIVWKSRWRDRIVAVKHIDSEAEKKAFSIEVRQLSRVSHPNIVKLYGACTKNPVCLVMEYAEGGSLYNVLHGHPQVCYTASHAVSWALQCARGVAYLHEMKPKALIHRDLKPPNLLLVMGGKVLKICDFGTACDKHTHMTNNKGSAAWMAPEVFTSSTYTEKCDVFSWGIILWEVITRRKPFGEVGGPAYRIMWAVYNGTRPPAIKKCPPPIEKIMQCCWDNNPSNRPSMQEVVRRMSHLCHYFSPHPEPLYYDNTHSYQSENIPSTSVIEAAVCVEEADTTCSSFSNEVVGTGTYSSIHHEAGSSILSSRNMKKEREAFTPLSVHVDENAFEFGGVSDDLLQKHQPVPSVMTPTHQWCQYSRHQVPATYRQDDTVSSNSYVVRRPDRVRPSSIKRHSADLQNLTFIPPQQETLPLHKPVGHRRSSSYGNPADISSLNLSEAQHIPPSVSLHDVSHRTIFHQPMYSTQSSSSSANTQDLIQNAYLMLDPQLQPFSPSPGNPESMWIFEEHKQIAQEYLRVQTELAILARHRNELSNQVNESEPSATWDERDIMQFREELRQLKSENESLYQLHHNLKRQLEIMKGVQKRVRHTRPAPPPPTTTSNEDSGWVLVPES